MKPWVAHIQSISELSESEEYTYRYTLGTEISHFEKDNPSTFTDFVEDILGMVSISCPNCKSNSVIRSNESIINYFKPNIQPFICTYCYTRYKLPRKVSEVEKSMLHNSPSDFLEYIADSLTETHTFADSDEPTSTVSNAVKNKFEDDTNVIEEWLR